MRNSIKAEIKTFVKMKSIWVCITALIVFSALLFNQSYDTAINESTVLHAVMDELYNLAGDDGDIDTSYIEEVALDIYKTYHPKMSINNATGLLIGLGLIFFPIASSLYMGIEYSRNKAIKYKITHSTLIKTFISKCIVISIFAVATVLLYSSISYILALIRWKTLHELLLQIDFVNYNSVSLYTFKNNLLLLVLVSSILIFYSVISMLVSAFMKSGTYGVISVIAINYIVIPSSYSPHNVIFSLINRVVYTSPISPYEFKQSGTVALAPEVDVALFVGYLLFVTAVLLFLGKVQKNN